MTYPAHRPNAQPVLVRSRRRIWLTTFLNLGLLGGPAFGFGATTNQTDPANEFAIEAWRTERGLPQNTITALRQTRAGYIWASTYNGLVQFDGIRFKIMDSANTPELPNSRITSLFEDHEGRLWIGHDTGDLTRYADGTFQTVPIGDVWQAGQIASIQADAQGDVWLIGSRGEALRVRDKRLITPPELLTDEPNVVPQVVNDRAGRLLVCRNGYVAELTTSAYRLLDFRSDETRPYYSRIAPSADGGLWVLEQGNMRKWRDNAWREDVGPPPWGNASLTAVLENSSGQVWVGTLQSGLFIYDPKLGWMNLNRTNGLPQDWVRCITEDHERNMWVGTSGGLVLLRPRKVVMQNPPDQWQGCPVLAITQTRTGTVWAGTEGAGVYRLDDKGWTHFAADSGLSNPFVWSVLEDSAGRIWAGTWGGGLFRLEADRFVRQFDLAERGDPVTALLEFPVGTLWIGTEHGLIRCVDDQIERLAPLGGAAAGAVRALAPGRNGELWIGTQGHGLGRFKDGKLETFRRADGLSRDFILSLYQDPDGTLWIGTLDRGLCRYRDGKFIAITTEHGLPNNVIGHIEDDLQGNFWLNSQIGLFRISRNDLNACAEGRLDSLPVLAYGNPEGLATLAGSSGFTPSGFRSPDGRLWFPTARGIAVVNPQSGRRNSVPPPVWIEEILVDRQPVTPKKITPPVHARAAAAPANPMPRRIELPPGRRLLDVSFTALSYTSPERVRFKYRLEGLDSAWTEAGPGRRVTYSFLPPDDYVFRVIACNSDGLWNETGDALAIRVLPHFWQTLWFKALLAVGSCAAVGGGVYFISRRRHRRKLERIARERALERERARIAQDIHDDLGASLTRIGLLSESAAGDLEHPHRAATNLEQIISTTRDLTRSMDEIVWAVNPRHDTLESLTNYISHFAHDFLSTARIRCRLAMPLQLPEIVVRSEVRHNLFLACKEALNNVVKHSAANEVRLTLEIVPDGLRFIIADNGPGFDLKRLVASGTHRHAAGNGLSNLERRLQQIGGRSRLHSTPGEGTSVEFFVPLTETTPPERTPT